MPIVCSHCNAPIPDQNVDRARDIATCQSCGRLMDLRARRFETPPGAASSGEAPMAAPRLRPAVPLPPGMTIGEDKDHPPAVYRREHSPSLLITRRWLRKKHFVMLVVVLAATAGAAYFWVTQGFSIPLAIGSLMLVSWNYALLTMFLNTTAVRAQGGPGGTIDVRHGPLPYLASRDRMVAVADLRQLFAVANGPVFSVDALLNDGTTVALVRPLVDADQAMFVEQQLERAIGLLDYAVPGEIDAAFPAPVPGPGKTAASGGRAVAALGPIIAVTGVGLFFVLARTEVSGSLSASGALGSWEFTPNDCRSGQLDGFFGVELRGDGDADPRLRLTRDPIRGDLVIVQQKGMSTTMSPEEGCNRFALELSRTNTTINDVRVVEGSLSLDCDTLSGTVTFSGCH